MMSQILSSTAVVIGALRVKWSKQPYPRSSQKKVENIGHKSYITIIKTLSGPLATLAPA